MAEKVAIPQVNYVSDNPEQDWENFQNAMRHTLKVPKIDDDSEQSQKNSNHAVNSYDQSTSRHSKGDEGNQPTR